MFPLLVLALLAADEPTPQVPIGKETTSVTGPLTKEGYIDYETALNERLSKGITPERNANVLLLRALGPRLARNRLPATFYKWLRTEEPPEQGDYLVPLEAYIEKQVPGDADARYKVAQELYAVLQRPWAAKDQPLLAGWLRGNEKPLALVVEASKRPDYYLPLVTRDVDRGPGGLLSLLYHPVRGWREATLALRARALLRVQEGKHADAWQDLLACYRLGRLVARGGTVFELRTGLNIDAGASWCALILLERVRPEAAVARRWLADLHALPPLPALADKLDLAERLIYLDGVQFAQRHGLAKLLAEQGFDTDKQPLDAGPLPTAVCAPALRHGNQLIDRLVTTARMTDRRRRAAEWDRLYQEHGELRLRVRVFDRVAALKEAFGGVPAERIVAQRISDVTRALLQPNGGLLSDLLDRTEQTHRNLRVAFALVAYQREKGNYPANLAALAPAYLPALPDDLYAGEPLVYRLTRTGFLLYSVGANGQDDGGQMQYEEPAGDDLGVRLLLR